MAYLPVYHATMSTVVRGHTNLRFQSILTPTRWGKYTHLCFILPWHKLNEVSVRSVWLTDLCPILPWHQLCDVSVAYPPVIQYYPDTSSVVYLLVVPYYHDTSCIISVWHTYPYFILPWHQLCEVSVAYLPVIPYYPDTSCVMSVWHTYLWYNTTLTPVWHTYL